MNDFDEMHVDLPSLYKEVSEKPQSIMRPRWALPNLARFGFRSLLVASGVHRRILYSNFSTVWLQPFERFWRTRLGGRPMDVIDFHYLRLSYRSRFQDVGHTDEGNPEAYLEAWQSDANLYLVFGSVWNQTRDAYMAFRRALRYLPRKGAILEYGAGTAPITTGLLKYFGHRKYKFTIADILQVNYIYGIEQVGAHAEHVLLTPYENLLDREAEFDAIFCMTVMEHLPNPEDVVRSFHRALKPGGVLVFDYHMGEGEGLDSMGAITQRAATVAFMQDNFTLRRGAFKRDSSMGFTVIQKPR